MILMTLLGLVVMTMTSGVAGKTYLVKTADGGLPSAPQDILRLPLEQGIILF